MKPVIAIAFLTFGLAACQQAKEARITTETPVVPQPKTIGKARSEPIFYNGKTYQFNLTPGTGGAYGLAVSGMSAKQEKDATAVATSSLRYFACRDGQDSKLLSKPSFANGRWSMQARCV